MPALWHPMKPATSESVLRWTFDGKRGPHTIEALIKLQQQGISVQASLAGDSFQSGYRNNLTTTD